MAEELEHTEAAEKARKARCTASRRSLQKGGVLYASEARNMAVQRQEDEVARAKAIAERAERHRRRRNGKLSVRKLRLSERRFFKCALLGKI